ncbi:MAG: 3-keto-disaccharide hydrolase, partial [Verrucomicrobiales bacterium]
MRFSVLLLFLTGAGAALWADESQLIKAKDGSGVYGYKHTPKLPWCEWLVHDPDRPAPPKIVPGKPIVSSPPPEDAVVLFDGDDLSAWTGTDWEVSGGLLTATGKKSPATRQSFGSFQLHLEWKMPEDFSGPWHNQGNNGVLIHGLYEVQIFDSFNEPLYPD